MSTADDFVSRLSSLGAPIFVATRGGAEFTRPMSWQLLTPDGNESRIRSFKPGDAICGNCGGLFAVVDIDPRNGADVDAVRSLLAHLDVTVFAEVATPGGGRHLYIAGHSELASVHATADRPGLVGYPGVDVQSFGSNVYLPGTQRPKYAGDGYDVVFDDLAALADGGDPDGAAAFAHWVAGHRTGHVDQFEPTPPWDGSPPDTRQDAYLSTVLSRRCDQIAAMAPNSGRNTAVYTAALQCGSFVAGAGMDEGQVVTMLTSAATACRLVADDGLPSVLASIRSGLKNGRDTPRAVPDEDRDDDDATKTSQATRLVALALDRYRLLCGDDGRPYAVAVDGPNVALPFRRRGGLRETLARVYGDEMRGAVPSASALADALTVLEGHALMSDPEPVELRLAAYADGVIIDLGGVDGRCVHITATGWKILERSPVLFRRTALTSPLPEPLHGGTLDPLRDLLNVTDDGWSLVRGWLVAALLPELPHPILALLGEQGTAKTTAAKLMVELIDPSPAPLRSCPRDIRQWAVAASASWAVALDNVSVVPGWLSDTLCKAVTGDGIVDRALYTDDDVSVLAFRRVVAMTSIDAGALSGDLAERLLPVELQRIDDTARRTEADINTAFADARTDLLGALFTLLANVMATLPSVRLESSPRMADFAKVLAALDQVTGSHSLKAYTVAAIDVAETVVESDPFAEAVRRLALSDWSGTAGELLDEVTPDRPPRGWPKTARGVSGALRRLVPAFRATGVDVKFSRTGRTRTISITAMDERWERSSQPSPPSDSGSDQGERGDRERDGDNSLRDGSDANVPCDGGSPSDSGPSRLCHDCRNLLGLSGEVQHAFSYS